MEAFVEALSRYITEALRTGQETADYTTEALKVIDARNHLFVSAGCRSTDEEESVYALRDLCRLDEATLQLVPDTEKLIRLARTYF